MPFPISYPPVNGPGRMTEVCSFRRSMVSDEKASDVISEMNTAMSEWGIARHSVFAAHLEEPGLAVFIVDWVGAKEKDAFEPGEKYAGLKPLFLTLMDEANPTFACHHIVLPGAATTPQNGNFFAISHAKIPVAVQDKVAAVLERHLEATDSNKPLWLAAGPSREDDQTVVFVAGYDTREIMEKQTALLVERMRGMVGFWTSYTCKLSTRTALSVDPPGGRAE